MPRVSSEAAPVAVLGAGIAGLSCAEALQAAGRPVVVIDKGRGVAGRTSTRRCDGDPARGWDHGASGFLAEEPRFCAEVRRWLDAGWVGAWPVLADEDPRELLASAQSTSWTGTPSMSAIARGLAASLDLRVGMRVVALLPGPSGWVLRAMDREDQAHELGPFAHVVLTAPPAQSRALLADVAEELATRLESAWMLPSWSLLAVTAPPAQAQPLLRVGPGHLPDGVSALICEDSKPGRLPHPQGMRWTLQSTAEWARLYLEHDPEFVLRELSELLREAVGQPVLEAQVHRWRYARVHRPLGVDCVHDAALGLSLAGDFCRGDGVENAWLSGRAAAAKLRED